MGRTTSLLVKVFVAAAILLSSAPVGVAAGPGQAFARGPSAVSQGTSVLPVQSFFNSSFGFFGFSSPFISVPTLPPPYPYMPNYWWTGAYPAADPRQSGYNPSAGYKWEDITTLILETYPKKARVTLDGNFIGSSDDLGPIQLPFGEHTLRVEAPGYEPSETVLRVETRSLEQVNVQLKATGQPRP